MLSMWRIFLMSRQDGRASFPRRTSPRPPLFNLLKQKYSLKEPEPRHPQVSPCVAFAGPLLQPCTCTNELTGKLYDQLCVFIVTFRVCCCHPLLYGLLAFSATLTEGLNITITNLRAVGVCRVSRHPPYV